MASKTKAAAPASEEQSTADLVVPLETRQALTVDLVGHKYVMRPPKAILALMMSRQMKKVDDDPEGAIEALGKWLQMAFSKEVGQSIMDRLFDEEDDLDIGHIATLVRLTGEMTSGNPTT